MRKYIIIAGMAVTAAMPLHAQQDTQKVIPQDSIAIVMKAANGYLIGNNMPLNPEKAAKLYAALVKQGYAPAMTKMGQIFLNGDLGEKDTKKAFALFSKAAEQDDATALYELGRMFQFGIYAPRDYEKAMTFYFRSLFHGSPRAYYNVGYLYYKGLGTQQDYKKAEHYLLKGAEKGSPACCYLLACYYASDACDNPDKEKAEHYMSLAAKGGHGFARHAAVNGIVDSIFQQGKERRRIKALRAKEKKAPVTAYAPETKTLSGTWQGTLFYYDWSGSNVMDEKPVTFRINAEDDALSVEWMGENALVKSFRPVKKNDTFYVNADFNPNDRSVPWAVVSVNITANADNSVAMAIHAIKTNDREPMYPMIAELSRKETSSGINAITDIKGDHVKVSGKNIDITVHADEEGTAKIDILNPAGQLIQAMQTKVRPGYNTFTTSITAPSGQYIIRITGLKKARAFNITI